MNSRTQTTADLRLRIDAGVPMPLSPEGIYEQGRPSPRDRSTALGSSETKKILVIDGDPDVRELVAKTITQAGFRADTENDGESGWHAFRRVAYDLVITGNEMPGLTGTMLIQRIRGFSKEPPCMLISGNQFEAESTLVPLIGQDGFLAKPISPAALIEKVYHLLLHGQSMEP